jgi:hypothetical protein
LNLQTKLPNGTVLGLRNSGARYGYGYHVRFLVVSKNGFRQACKNTPENWKTAQSKAWEIEQDISTGNFDPTLAKYKPRTHLTLVKPVDKATTEH